MTFRQRVERFWEWFSDNEPRLSALSRQPGKEAFDEFFEQGTQLLANDVPFALLGRKSLAFSAEGCAHRFFLNPYIVSRMPAELRKSWAITAFLPGGRETSFALPEGSISMEEIQIALFYNPAQKDFNIRFYSPQLSGFPKATAETSFYQMLEVAVGDVLSYRYVNTIEMAGGKEVGMFPFSILQEQMVQTLLDEGEWPVENEDMRYVSYQLPPQPSEELRLDVVIGVSGYMDLINDYYDEETFELDALEQYGAKAAFLAFAYTGKENRRSLLNIRYDLQKRLQDEVLGTVGSGDEIGVVLGGAMGTGCVYLDILLFDEEQFLLNARTLLDQYNRKFYYSEFCQGSKLVKLFG